MANNKIILGNETLIDLTGDTVEADKLLQGYTAHDSSGNLITGSLVPSGDISGTYWSVEKLRVVYTGADLTEAAYINTVAAIKALFPQELKNSNYIVAGFEVISNSFEEGDWVAGGAGIDSYGSRPVRWRWTNGGVVRDYQNYFQNAKGNLHNGAVIDVYLLAL